VYGRNGQSYQEKGKVRITGGHGNVCTRSGLHRMNKIRTGREDNVNLCVEKGEGVGNEGKKQNRSIKASSGRGRKKKRGSFAPYTGEILKTKSEFKTHSKIKTESGEKLDCQGEGQILDPDKPPERAKREK